MGNVLNTLEEVLAFNTKGIFEDHPKDRFYGSCGSYQSAEDAIKRSITHTSKINQSVKLLNLAFEKFADSSFDMLPLQGVNMTIPEHILIVGCGGVGSWFLPKFVKLLNDGKRKGMISAVKTVTLCDGDEVEESNLIRQNFASRDVTKNKAECLFKRYSGEIHTAITLGYIDKYILEQHTLNRKKTEFQGKFTTFDNYLTSLGLNRGSAGNILIINLIDNNETRKDIHAFASTNIPSNTRLLKVSVLDVACATYNGQLNLSTPGFYALNSPQHNRLNVTSALNYFDQITENAFLNDKISVFDCSTRDANAIEQLFDINNLAATVLCSFMNTWVEKGKLYYRGVSFSTGQNLTIKPQYKMYDFYVDCYRSTPLRSNATDLEYSYNDPLSLMNSMGQNISGTHSLNVWVNNGRAKGGNNKKLFRSLVNTLQLSPNYGGEWWNQFKSSFVEIDKDDKSNPWVGVLLTKEEGNKLYKEAYDFACSLRAQGQSANESIIKDLLG